MSAEIDRALENADLLTDWERGFIASLRRQRKPPSEKQTAIVEQIVAKCRAAGASGTSALPTAIPVTFFTDYAARLKREEAIAPHELARRIEEMVAPEKARLPWLKLARFGTVRSEKNSLRHDANVLAISGVEADYDGGEIGFDAAVGIAGKAGLAGIIYTSPGHTVDAPRWRVLCPTSRELKPSDRDRMMARLNGLYGGIFADESFTLSQSYYYGHLAGSRDHRVEMLDGACIDLLDDLDLIARGKPNGSAGGGRDLNFDRARFGQATDEAALSAAIISGEFIS